MKDLEFNIEDNYIVKMVKVPSMPNTYKKEIVMDKETFIEAYDKWIRHNDAAAQ